MRQQWGNDEGQTHAKQHRDELVECMRWARQQLDNFNPDLVIVFGDDQYENFREDGVPAFQINCFESFEAKPWEHARPSPNAWNEAQDTVFRYKANRRAAKHLVTRLIEEGFEVAYAYEPRHEAMPHAILNTLLFLDWDRRGFDYPIVPFLTNCYGRRAHPATRAGVNNLAEVPHEDDLDPPGPTPWRCFDLGRALARILTSPWRAALVSLGQAGRTLSSPAAPATSIPTSKPTASTSMPWSPGTTSSGARPRQDIEEHGHQETLNWILMLGAMAELGRRKPQEARWVESWITNANKVFAVFRP